MTQKFIEITLRRLTSIQLASVREEWELLCELDDLENDPSLKGVVQGAQLSE